MAQARRARDNARPMRIYPGLDVQSDFGGRFPWKSRLVEVEHGVRQAVVDEGPRDAKLTFLLLHGNPTWSFLYREFIQRLSPHYRVVAPDHVVVEFLARERDGGVVPVPL